MVEISELDTPTSVETGAAVEGAILVLALIFFFFPFKTCALVPNSRSLPISEDLL